MAVTNNKRKRNMFGYPFMMNNGMTWRDVKEFEEYLEERDKKRKEKDKSKEKKPWPAWSFSQWLIILMAFGPWVGAIQWTLLKNVFGW